MDLNWENEALRQEIYKMVRWWHEKGVDGFRLDVINYISKVPGLPDGDEFIGDLMTYTGIERYFYGPKLHEYLRELRKESFEPYNAFSVGETPGIGLMAGRLLTDAYRQELDLIFSFDHLETPGHTRFDDYVYDLTYLKPYYMKHLNADRGYGWHTLFFNNHDNPRMISKIDPSGKYRVVLAKLLAVLQMTLRGTPFIYQGDEIGAENVKFQSINELKDVESLGLYEDYLEEGLSPQEAFKLILAGTRDHARQPMFLTKADEAGNSVLNFYRALISWRKHTPACVYGTLKFFCEKNKNVLRYRRALYGEKIYVEANLSPRRVKSCGSSVPKKFIMGNYPTSSSASLRPYEVRIYSLL